MRAASLFALAASGCVAALHVEQAAPASDVAPPFALTAEDGARVSLADGLARGPVVLVFYRGFW